MKPTNLFYLFACCIFLFNDVKAEHNCDKEHKIENSDIQYCVLKDQNVECIISNADSYSISCKKINSSFELYFPEKSKKITLIEDSSWLDNGLYVYRQQISNNVCYIVSSNVGSKYGSSGMSCISLK